MSQYLSPSSLPSMIDPNQLYDTYSNKPEKTQNFLINYDNSITKAPISKERTNKARLKEYSYRVLCKVKERGSTTYNQVADELVDEFEVNLNKSDKNSSSCEHKNIRRRVYDALNVLIALNIIQKDKKQIVYTGLPKTSILLNHLKSPTISLKNSQKLASNSQHFSNFDQKLNNKRRKIEQKRNQLYELVINKIGLYNLISRNVQRENENKIDKSLEFNDSRNSSIPDYSHILDQNIDPNLEIYSIPKEEIYQNTSFGENLSKLKPSEKSDEEINVDDLSDDFKNNSTTSLASIDQTKANTIAAKAIRALEQNNEKPFKNKNCSTFNESLNSEDLKPFYEKEDDPDHLSLPFLLATTPAHANATCYFTENEQEHCIEFDSELEIFEDGDVLSMIGMTRDVKSSKVNFKNKTNVLKKNNFSKGVSFFNFDNFVKVKQHFDPSVQKYLQNLHHKNV